MLVGRLAEAFQLHSLNRTNSALPEHLFGNGAGSFCASNVGVMEGIPAYCIKVETRFPSRNPTTSGCIHLFDDRTGRLLAILESSFVSAIGSALTGALATDLLAPPKARTLAVIGNGSQGWLSLRFLMEMRSLEEVHLFDLNRKRSLRVAKRLEKYEGLVVKVCDSLNQAVSDADIVCSATWSRKPFLFSEMIKPGAHISTLGSDEPGKAELSEELLRGCSFFCDDRDLASQVGALQGIKGGRKMVVAELGEVLAGEHEGRAGDDEITVYAPVGLPAVDLVASWVAYRRAVKRKVGTPYQL